MGSNCPLGMRTPYVAPSGREKLPGRESCLVQSKAYATYCTLWAQSHCLREWSGARTLKRMLCRARYKCQNPLDMLGAPYHLETLFHSSGKGRVAWKEAVAHRGGVLDAHGLPNRSSVQAPSCEWEARRPAE